ncbi:Nucleolar protein 6 [Camellia lanceoleosa]|uniref:Nucleolar protein 6 n=1 Tax=Camellia lanceoleosa TaxID=1840588 RepID=A0ACC0I189_9ERIC|nr:Nucleolar protein 6 [Camellia lanceoleosa]
MALDTLTDPMDLKVKELLKEVQLHYSPSFTKLVDDTVSAIKESIDKIPEDLQVTADVAPGFIRDIGADKVEFKFRKPKSIEIGGSYSMHCIAKPDINVDLFVRMPKELFHEKDYLNYRYHAKRCLYLCIIKKYLKLSSVAQKVEWSTFQNEARKPILVVHPDLKVVESPIFVVRVIPTATSVFNVSKLNMERNNVRALNQGGVLHATPKYNSSILEDLFLEDNAEFVRKTFLGWKELGEALILLKVWARQRSSIYAHDCLSGFLISVIMVYLTTKSGGKRINNSMNTMQIFRVTMDFIATSKLWETGLFFQPQGESNTLKERRTSLQSFPLIICDPFAGFNLTFRMTRSGFLGLQDEAALTLSCIDKCRDGGFDEVFMTKIDFPAKYDYCIRLNLKGKSEVYALGFCLDDECWRLYEQKVHSLMHEGLNDRAKFIRVMWRNTASGYNLEDGLSVFDGEPLLIGISVSTLEKAFRVVDIGPNAENKDEALKFRKFWGEKAELRRFKDSTIAESAVWECKQWERHLIIKRISEHVLVRHLSLSKENIMTIVDQLDFSLLYGAEDPIAFSASLVEAFDVLSKRLRLLNDIPLRVSSVQALDSAFRFTSVFPPEPHPLAVEKGVSLRLQKLISSCIQPLDVMIQLEGSGNWPMDDAAIEKTKSAFLLKIGESLQNSWGITCNATEDDVVVYTSGYAFCLKILHERGLSLLKKQIGSNQVKRVPSTDRILFIRGQHSSMINGLQGRYPIYGPVVRLAKRWVAAHLFSTSLAEEAIELLVAYLFLKPLPFYAPCSRIIGFLRFLRLLSEYDWAFSALIVDINGDMTLNDEKEVNGDFMSSRKAHNENRQNISPAMFLATAYDKVSEAWTRSSPTSSELRRLVAYAKSSANLLAKLILQDQHDSYRWECLFRTPLNNYNAVVLLHRDRLPYPHRLLFPSELKQGKHVVRGNASKVFHPFMLPGDMKGSSEELKHKLMVNFDPLRCFVGDLEREFPAMFKMWYDSLGGDAIGLTWERLGSSKKRGRGEVGEDDHDLLDVLKTVGKVGKGFVRSIYFLKAPRLSN